MTTVDLQQRLPSRLVEARTVSRRDLRDDYLPTVVIRPERGWYPMPFTEKASVHFEVYGGRCFVQTFIHPHGWDENRFFKYWQEISRRFGRGLHLEGKVPPLPAGSETVLVRSFGVFLTDGSFADTHVPEEILIRLFKYTESSLDMTTSDYVGTLLYQYKMQREKLLNDPSSLGLQRLKTRMPSSPASLLIFPIVSRPAARY